LATHCFPFEFLLHQNPGVLVRQESQLARIVAIYGDLRDVVVHGQRITGGAVECLLVLQESCTTLERFAKLAAKTLVANFMHSMTLLLKFCNTSRMALQYIFMGDITGSRKLDSRLLARDLKKCLEIVQTKAGHLILSPLTTTQGDEFQGVVRSLKAGVSLLLLLEETLLRENFSFALHYVLHEGEIDTAINPQRAWEMLGPGLITARSALGRKGRGRRKFQFLLDDPARQRRLEAVFLLLERLQEEWSAKDHSLIAAMIASQRDEEVGRRTRKDRSQIWRRRRTLRIEDYRLIRDLALDLATSPLKGTQLEALRRSLKLSLSQAAKAAGMDEVELRRLEKELPGAEDFEAWRNLDKALHCEWPWE